MAQSFAHSPPACCCHGLASQDRIERVRHGKPQSRQRNTESTDSLSRGQDNLLETLRYMRMATAAYGRVALNPGSKAAITQSNFAQLLCEHLRGDLAVDQAEYGKGVHPVLA